ncbi:MAG: IS200/IS605 family transposase [Anaerolineae bacterium]|nr:IS200/IS605 family transposase [Candidatus Roseilinea sp.]MDW8448968.1 IS200/IS605 family transposase [Anaerolineae bacterium]
MLPASADDNADDNAHPSCSAPGFSPAQFRLTVGFQPGAILANKVEHRYAHLIVLIMAYWRLFYHFVWSTKLRRPLITEAIEAPLYKIIVAKAEEVGALVHAVGGVEDHVHLVASVPPAVSLSEFINRVKGSSSHFVNHALDMPFAWQAEYGVLSFGGKQLSFVVQYVKRQREHHRDGTTLPGLEVTHGRGESSR